MLKPFRKYYEKNAAKTSPRFRLFVDAKQLYLDFLEKYQNQSVERIRSQASKDQDLMLAESKYLESIQLAKDNSAFNDAATGLFQLSLLYNLQGRYDEVITVLHEAIDIYNDIPNLDHDFKQTLRDCYYNIGLAAIQKKDMATARENLDTALAMHRDVKDFEGIRLVSAALAQIPD